MSDPMTTTPAPTLGRPRPLVLVRGFGSLGVGDEQRNPYQGFNEGSVYPGKRGENFIYEGFVLRAVKAPRLRYVDATNVVSYHRRPVPGPEECAGFDPGDVGGDRIVLDPDQARSLAARVGGIAGTLWIYRYYDLEPRSMTTFADGLLRLIHLIRRVAAVTGAPFDGVDVVAHSMGGLITGQAIRQLSAAHRAEQGQVGTAPGSAPLRHPHPGAVIHKVVTLGTPHRGIAFQILPRWLTSAVPGGAADELAAFDPRQKVFHEVVRTFDPRRILTVVGTDFRSYGVAVASAGNRLASLFDEGTLLTNRSDGLVKQSAAQLPGSPRTFVHKCHGGEDSLVTSREAYEIAMRFLHGTHHVRLSLEEARVLTGLDTFGRSELYLGVRIKPRGPDFDLFHQSPEAQNCYGPFRSAALDDPLPALAEELARPLAEDGDDTTYWAGDRPGERLIWEGWVDERDVLDPLDPELVFRLDVSVTERDSLGVAASDTIVFRKQYFVQVFPGSPIRVFVHTDSRRLGPGTSSRLATSEQAAETASRAAGEALGDEGGPSPDVQEATPVEGDSGAWLFRVAGTGFRGTFRLGVERVPPDATT
ncbi:hypothetical protein GCM10009737_09200 [Nocardioides lentus]|uniref:Alpha/beta hydrolase n=1 Tax=Nocardioides lentus TaxID=338077 RepID=A0ABP5ADE5_9ACTN